jgi:hypothetical protein
VRLGRRIEKNGSHRYVDAGRRDKMKNKIINKYIYRLIAGKLIKMAKGIYKKVSNIQNLIFK